MNLNELKDYRNWIGKSPDKVFLAAKGLGGWKSVFPDKLPVWASKVRNYFNVLPAMLKRLPDANAKGLLQRPGNLSFLVECHEVQAANKKWQNYKKNPWGGYDPPPFKVPAGCPTTPAHNVVHMSTKEATALKSSLTGDVYLDNLNRVWFQMAAGSTIYHFGENRTDPTADAIYQNTVLGQNDTPVFKLVCPDDNGGSNEVIIFNPVVKDGLYDNRSERLGLEVNKYADIRGLIETDAAYQGSYNYSETTRVGLAEHEKRDVKPHMPGRFFYVNPPDQFTPLELRRFPELDMDQKPLADQK